MARYIIALLCEPYYCYFIILLSGWLAVWLAGWVPVWVAWVGWVAGMGLVGCLAGDRNDNYKADDLHQFPFFLRCITYMAKKVHTRSVRAAYCGLPGSVRAGLGVRDRVRLSPTVAGRTGGTRGGGIVKAADSG